MVDQSRAIDKRFRHKLASALKLVGLIDRFGF